MLKIRAAHDDAFQLALVVYGIRAWVSVGVRSGVIGMAVGLRDGECALDLATTFQNELILHIPSGLADRISAFEVASGISLYLIAFPRIKDAIGNLGSAPQ